MQRTATLQDYVGVRTHPTVVRLDDLEKTDSGWLSDSFIITPDLRNHLQSLTALLRGNRGSGVFLIGHYGSGKSHFLAYLTQGLRTGELLESPPQVVPLSLINYSAANRLEDILAGALGVAVTTGDRRPFWDALLERHPQGLLLVVDEVSEFLRAKADSHAFNEDVRFLQFMGEWVQDKRAWIIAAMQEGIEHTGELEYGLYRKIKDRYPLRLLLTPAHVRTLIADSVLVKKPGYDAAVAGLCQTLRESYPPSVLDYETLAAVYPLHPVTLALLEEVRDRFSQARGVVDFTVTRLRGDPARQVSAFLEQPWGSLLTPDAIVDHFRDLFEVQPEFLPLAQQVFPWYQRHLEEVFDRPALRELAQQVLNLLVLVYLSPVRTGLAPQEAATWLLFSASRVAPERNRKIVERVLAGLAERGRYVVIRTSGYQLDLRDEGGAALERLLKREIAALQGQDALVLEALLPLLPAGGFNPFSLPREQWQHRQVLWHFHPRPYAVWLGDGTPPPIEVPREAPIEGIALCLRLPWSQASPAAYTYTVRPAPITVTADLVELAALLRLQERPASPELTQRIRKRLDARGQIFAQSVRSSWQDAELITPDGHRQSAPRLESRSTLDTWLESTALWILRRTYPAFERFAPGHGPLTKEAWLRFMRFAAAKDLGAAEADDYVKLIREAYLVPMGLLRRKGREYQTPANLDKHELVRLITPLLEHNPAPKTVHEHLAEPIYGLVPDQVNLLLVFLLLQGEIDILKDRKSYRDSFETLPNPLHYDRLTLGHALGMEQVNALQRLCEGLNIRTPGHWSVLTQRRCAGQLRELGRQQVERLRPLLKPLQDMEQGARLAERLQAHMDRWSALEKGEHLLQGLEQFLFEIGSVSVFIDEAKAYGDLPERVQWLLTETQRFSHLLAQSAVRQAMTETQGLDPQGAPGLDDPEAVERWLRRARAAYEQYKQAYGDKHQGWWQNIAAHALWTWQAPALAASRYLELREALEALESCRREAAKLRCRGLVNLDYQPQCTCGFDGEIAPIVTALERFDSLRHGIETRLRLFFQQDEVKARLRDWQREGIEMSPATLSYLEGERAVPEVRDVESFDRYLSGAELATEVEVASVVELLGQRVWEPRALLAALEGQLNTAAGRRLRFTGEVTRELPHELLHWCSEQSVRQAVPLPTSLDRRALGVVTQALRAEWISPATLGKLEQLGLDETGVDRVLAWVLDGHVPLPAEGWPQDSLLGALATLLRPQPITTPAQLATASAMLYRAHARLGPLAQARWLEHLDGLANTPVADTPELVEVLQKHLSAQWLLLDCLGLPLRDALEPKLREVFCQWQYRPPEFARVSINTSTDACYRDLLNADIAHTFEKCNSIDELLHQGFAPFADLVALASTQVEVTCKRLLAKFDPHRPLLIFADHGFRITPDGRSYAHGGASMLERLVPVWHWDPKK